MKAYEYDLTPRPAALGGGWKLRLLQDGQEVGGGVFPLPWQDEPERGVHWWNEMSEDFRAHWLSVASSAVPAEAWLAYLTEEARYDAQEEGAAWLASRAGEGKSPSSL